MAPTPEQEVRFGQHAGYARFAYNWALGEFKAGLDVGEWLSDRTLRPRWNVVKKFIAPWGAELSQNAAKYAIIDLGQARPLGASIESVLSPAGVPVAAWDSPSSSGGSTSRGFRADNGSDTVRVDGKTVILPKIGMVAMVEDLRFRGSSVR